jgi:hypothetical protein
MFASIVGAGSVAAWIASALVSYPKGTLQSYEGNEKLDALRDAAVLAGQINAVAAGLAALSLILQYYHI